jgi:hypothetical protein
MAQLPKQKTIKANKYVPILISTDSLFLQQIDSLIFNSIYSDIINEEKIKIFNVECINTDNIFILLTYMLCEMRFLKNVKLQGCFEYQNYLFLWYGSIPESLWNISKYTKKLTYYKGEPFDIPIITCDLPEFIFDYIDGNLILKEHRCY